MYDGVGFDDYEGNTVDDMTLQLVKDSSYVLEALAVKVPTGRFKIEVSIADRNGNRTKNTYRLSVLK